MADRRGSDFGGGNVELFQHLRRQHIAGSVFSPRGQAIKQCPQFSQPELKALGTGARHFLVDSVDVVALLTKNEQDSPDDKLNAKHEWFITQLKDASEAMPELSAVVELLTQDRDQVQSELRKQKAKVTDKATFAIADGETVRWLVHDDSWHQWYAQKRQSIADKRTLKRKSQADQMLCLVTGDLVDPVATHGSIRGLSDVGGHSTGDKLASFKQGAFQHYGLDQAANAAMGEDAVAMYVTAFNRLLQSAVKVADRKVTYWYVGDDGAEVELVHDPIAEILDGETFVVESDEDEVSPDEESLTQTQAETSAAKTIGQIKHGGPAEVLHEGRFVALSLSANPTRIIVRDVREGRFDELQVLNQTWRDDLQICRLSGTLLPQPSMDRLVTATLRDKQPGEDYEKWIAPASPIYSTLWNAALSASRENISFTAAVQAYQRLRLSMINGECETYPVTRRGRVTSWICTSSTGSFRSVTTRSTHRRYKMPMLCL